MIPPTTTTHNYQSRTCSVDWFVVYVKKNMISTLFTTSHSLDGRCVSACHYPLELPHLPDHQSCSPNFHLFVLMPETGVENDASRAAQRSRWPEEPVPSIECCYPRSLLYSLSKYRDSARPFHSFPPPPTARWIPDHSAGLTPSALGSSSRLTPA